MLISIQLSHLSLYPNQVTIESDKEKILTCGVKKYLPRSLDIKWIKIVKDSQVTTVRGEDTCIEASVKSDDGPFNINSKLRVQPSLQDNGNVYRCVANHRSLTDSILLDATLTVTAPKLDIRTSVGSLIVSIVTCLLVEPIAFLYIKHYKPPPAALDSIQRSTDEPTAEESLTLTCRAHSFFPERIELCWYKDGEQLSEGSFTSFVTKGSDGPFFCNSVLEVIP
nr:PREDICTED: natural cytotoxicity triggering receptor 3 ligand 1 [Struthio camelus australis]